MEQTYCQCQQAYPTMLCYINMVHQTHYYQSLKDGYCLKIKIYIMQNIWNPNMKLHIGKTYWYVLLWLNCVFGSATENSDSTKCVTELK